MSSEALLILIASELRSQAKSFEISSQNAALRGERDLSLMLGSVVITISALMEAISKAISLEAKEDE